MPERNPAAMHGFGLDLIDDGAVLRVYFENLIRIDLVQNPEVTVRSELEVIRLLDAKRLEQLLNTLRNDRQFLLIVVSRGNARGYRQSRRGYQEAAPRK